MSGATITVSGADSFGGSNGTITVGGTICISRELDGKLAFEAGNRS